MKRLSWLIVVGIILTVIIRTRTQSDEDFDDEYYEETLPPAASGKHISIAFIIACMALGLAIGQLLTLEIRLNRLENEIESLEFELYQGGLLQPGTPESFGTIPEDLIRGMCTGDCTGDIRIDEELNVSIFDGRSCDNTFMIPVKHDGYTILFGVTYEGGITVELYYRENVEVILTNACSVKLWLSDIEPFEPFPTPTPSGIHV